MFVISGHVRLNGRRNFIDLKFCQKMYLEIYRSFIKSLNNAKVRLGNKNKCSQPMANNKRPRIENPFEGTGAEQMANDLVDQIGLNDRLGQQNARNPKDETGGRCRHLAGKN
ncbi:hypothetical protein BLOT_001781 [Blomia tropicalis]|nr:hypothetical protein BLOT_001781 [Blomia tropicalis]